MRPALTPPAAARAAFALLLGLAVPGSAAAVVGVAVGASTLTPVAGGAAFNYTVTITNLDAVAAATNVVMTDALPPGARYLSASLSGANAAAFWCRGPANGENGVVECRAATLPASGVAIVTIVAQYEPDLAGGVRTNTARVVAGGTASTAAVMQTVSNNANLTQSTASGVSGRFGITLLTLSNSGSSSGVNAMPGVALPAATSFVSAHGTHDLADRCSFDPVTATVACLVPFVRTGAHGLTLVYERLDRLFRDGFEQ